MLMKLNRLDKQQTSSNLNNNLINCFYFIDATTLKLFENLCIAFPSMKAYQLKNVKLLSDLCTKFAENIFIAQ